MKSPGVLGGHEHHGVGRVPLVDLLPLDDRLGGGPQARREGPPVGGEGHAPARLLRRHQRTNSEHTQTHD